MGETRVTPIAVIGMGCRLPGAIESPEQLWQALLRGDDLVSEVPADRWDAEEYYDPVPGTPGRSVSKWGAFIDDVAGFDAGFFEISEPEATAIDPQHRMLLETSWEAVEHAGINPTDLAGSQTDVFIGLTHADYALLVADTDTVDGFDGTNFGLASGRIAHTLGLTGTASTVDSACSSSLLALHLACRSLHDGTSALALAGGASVMLDPRRMASQSAQGLLSPTGHCRAFDTAADGFVSAEGCAVVVLKRLPDAMRDGDRILAVIRGTAVNQSGGAAMSPDAHVSLYRTALASAGVDASTIEMVEAHGIGSPADDRAEYASLAQVYGIDSPCALGSVKTNLGHAHSVSGLLSLMKAALALQHGSIPGTLHFTGLPMELARIGTKLSVPQTVTPWNGDNQHPRRAAVSSHGLSGTNVHAIVEQAPEPRPGESVSQTPKPLMFALSATDAGALRRTFRRLAEWLDEQPDRATPTDLAYTLARRRAHRPTRTIVTATDIGGLVEELRTVADGDATYPSAVGDDDRGPVWVFSAHGSAWTGIGPNLLATEPAFAAIIAEAEPLIADEAGFSVTEAISSPESIAGPERVLPIMFTVQVAAARALQSYGVHPGAVIGHSLGEVAAAVVAGVLSLHDGIRVITRAARLMSTIAGAGAMASVELPAKQVLSEFAARGVSDVALAAVSSSQSTVVGGPHGSVGELMSAWQQRGIEVTAVDADVAWNSAQVDPILDDLTEALTDLSPPAAPTVPYYSATLFEPREQPEWDAWYWADNVRYTVRFAAAVQAAIEDGFRVFAEPAQQPWLARAIEQTADGLDVPVAVVEGTLDTAAGPHALRNLVTQLHSAGAAVDFSVLYPDGRLVDAPLPSWSRRPLLLSRGKQRKSAGAHAISTHPLLGPHVRLHEDPERHAWQGELSSVALPWLSDHRISEVTTLPGAAYCEMALAAARAVFDDASEVRDISFERTPLSVDPARVFATATVASGDTLDFAVDIENTGEYTRRCTARLAIAVDEAPAESDISTLLAEHPSSSEGAVVREWLDDCGVHYGPAYSGLAVVHASDTASTVVAEITLPGPARSTQSAFGIHPALLEAAFQAVLSRDSARGPHDGQLVPVGARRIRIHRPTDGARYCYARVTNATATGLEADLEVLDRSGAALMSIHGLRFEADLSPQDRRDRQLDTRLLAMDWRQRPLPDASDLDAGTWLLVSTGDAADSAAGEMRDAFTASGAHPTTMRWSPPADDPGGPGLAQAQVPSGQLDGVVVLIRPQGDGADAVVQGLEQARLLTRIVRELTELAGEPPRLYVVTRNAQPVLPADVPDLPQAGLRGLMRVIAVEQPHMRATLIDTDDATDPRQLAQQVISGSDEDMTAWRNGAWFTARAQPSPLRPDERRTTVADHERDGIMLRRRTSADDESLEVVTRERVPPGTNEIEVAVAAAGLNSETDFAGVVTAVGAQVDGHHIGDRVAGIAPQGSLGTFVTCDARLVATLPESLADGPAAAAPTSYVTAWHCLHDLAHISPGDTVLIHAATSSAGLAAIAVARAAGAEVFASASSAQSRELLHDMGINHIYDSGDTEWAEQIRRATNGRGVDVVINSVTGAAQHAGMRLVSPAGHFIDIGGQDTEGQPGIVPLQRNISMHSVELGALTLARPQRVHDLLVTVFRTIADGTLPAPHCTRHAFADVATALPDVRTGNHIVEIPRAGHTVAVVPPENARVFRSDGSYIITGGLSGFGLSLAAAMAEAGCGRIVLTSGGDAAPDAHDTVERMRAAGADITIQSADIAEPGSADRAVALAIETGLPVRGVLHAAATLREATVIKIDDELIESQWAPKAHGAWHLHRATLAQPLDWFCSFSSVAALLGTPGQGADAAADSWLDSFARWRCAQGLPATTIAWGQLDAVDSAHAFATLLRHDRAYSGYAAVESLPWLPALTNHSRFVEQLKELTQKRTGARRLRAELSRMPRQDWNARLIRLLSEQIGAVMHQAVLPDRPLFDYGLDSLANLEVRTRIETETGVGIVPTDLTTVRELAAHLCDEIAAALPGTNSA